MFPDYTRTSTRPLPPPPPRRPARADVHNDRPGLRPHAQGYKGMGCCVCSTPVRASGDQRAGRWRWFNSDDRVDPEEAKECGLHIPMYNI